MEINKKLWPVLAISFSIITLVLIALYFVGHVNIDYIMITLGLTQLFGGISQIDLADRINSKVVRKRNKSVGVLIAILGLVIFTAAIIKTFF